MIQEIKYLKATSKVEVIEFLSKKGKKMCKILVTKDYEEDGIKKKYEHESTHFIADNPIDNQFKLSNMKMYDMLHGLNAIEALRKCVEVPDNYYLLQIIRTSLDTVTVAIMEPITISSSNINLDN
jgi:hypothetical protein